MWFNYNVSSQHVAIFREVKAIIELQPQNYEIHILTRILHTFSDCCYTMVM